MNRKELIDFILKGIAEDLKKEQRDKGLVASGKSAAAITIEATDSGGSIDAPAFHFQITGRKAGPFKDGIKTMMEWIKHKGITPKDPKTSIRSLAFLFARKISQKGNDIYLRKRKGIEFKGIVEKWREVGKEKYIEYIKELFKPAKA